MKRLNYYEVEKTLACPYCGDAGKYEDSLGCCGESSAHFEYVYETKDGETYPTDEVELYYPIMDVLRYEIFNKLAWRSRIAMYKRRANSFLTKVYDGTYPANSIVRQIRVLTGFQWTALDRYILEKLYGWGTYWTNSPEYWAALRKERVAQYKKELLETGKKPGWNLAPRISDEELGAV